MKKKRITDTFNNLNETIIEEATIFQKSSGTRRSHWIKWTAIAACFMMVIAFGLPTLKNVLLGPDKQIIDSVQLIIYDNAYYEIISENPEALKKFGVATRITEDIIGSHISYLQPEHPAAPPYSNYIVSEEKTEWELLEYLPANNKAHRIFRNGENYYIVRFCNYLIPDDASCPVTTALEVYGIFDAKNIKSITPTSTDNTWQPTGPAITDKAAIAIFYNELIALKHFSEEEYHELVFAEDLKAAEEVGGGDVGDEVYAKHANDCHVLVIETMEGIRFTIDYYPSYGWFKFSETQSYCQMTPAMKVWLDDNL